LAELDSPDVVPDEDEPWRYRPHRRVLANVTDLGILLKSGTSSGLIWVARLSTGKPVPGAAVTLYSPQGKVVHRGNTDKDGILRLPGASQLLGKPGAGTGDEGYDEYDTYRSQRLIAV